MISITLSARLGVVGVSLESIRYRAPQYQFERNCISHKHKEYTPSNAGNRILKPRSLETFSMQTTRLCNGHPNHSLNNTRGANSINCARVVADKMCGGGLIRLGEAPPHRKWAQHFKCPYVRLKSFRDRSDNPLFAWPPRK